MNIRKVHISNEHEFLSCYKVQHSHVAKGISMNMVDIVVISTNIVDMVVIYKYGLLYYSL